MGRHLPTQTLLLQMRDLPFTSEANTNLLKLLISSCVHWSAKRPRLRVSARRQKRQQSEPNKSATGTIQLCSSFCEITSQQLGFESLHCFLDASNRQFRPNAFIDY